MAGFPISIPLGRSALALCGFIGTTAAQEFENSRPVPREVVLLTSTHTDDPGDEHANAEAHFLLQMPLNHLGMVVRMQPLNGPQPPAVDPAVTRAVLVHLTGAEPELPAWFGLGSKHRRTLPNLRFVHLGSIEPLRRADPARFGRWFARWGLQVPPPSTSNALRVGFENHVGSSYAVESPPLGRSHCGPLAPSAGDAGIDLHPWLTTTDQRFPRTDPPSDRHHAVGRLGTRAVALLRRLGCG